MGIKKTFIIFLTFVSIANAYADLKSAENNFKNRYIHTTVTSFTETPAQGIYQVVMGKNVVYVDESGRYFMFGHLFDMQSQHDITADAVKTIKDNTKIDITHLPIEKAIKYTQGDGSRIMYGFIDPDCPYCKQVIPNLEQLKNVTIYYFLYPLSSIHPNAERDSLDIWCSKNQYQMMNDIMVKRKEVTHHNTCDNPLKFNKEMADNLSINGTPSFVFEDGSTSSGALSVNMFENQLGIAHQHKYVKK